MSFRVEISEEQWLESFSSLEDPRVDYVRLDLTRPAKRPWLADARLRVELIGFWGTEGSAEAVDRGLDEDVDFLCLGGGSGRLDLRRLPLRLMVEEARVGGGDAPPHFGAAWARRLRDWGDCDPDDLEAAARRERIFLVTRDVLPTPELLARVRPFGVVLPPGAGPEVARDLLQE